MMSITHAVSGAYIASVLPNPLLYVPLALACHYAQDFIPHWDFGTGIKKGVRSIKATFMFALIDLIIAALLIMIFWQQTPFDFNIHIWMGAFAGIFPDLMEAPTTFLGMKMKFLRPLAHLHDVVHHSTTSIAWGILPQLLIIVTVGYLALLG
ncbi:MAG: hypothetical protein LBG64_04310 [Pseudomonadales bacterium]|jgi:hypothetical protein|nr:hypothetical protein [Pseudomonadales bacterium]